MIFAQKNLPSAAAAVPQPLLRDSIFLFTFCLLTNSGLTAGCRAGREIRRAAQKPAYPLAKTPS